MQTLPARHYASPGDVAEAALFVPLTMGMGESLPLVPPSPSFKEPGEGGPTEVPARTGGKANRVRGVTCGPLGSRCETSHLL